MKVQESTNWRGRIRVTATYTDGTQQVDEFDNLIVHAGRNLMRDALRGQGDLEIKYVALGSGTSAVTTADTQLVNERERYPVVTRIAGGTGMLTSIAYIQAYEATGFTIGEIGWFAGVATETKDSGTLISRVLYSRTKTLLESLQIERTDTIS